MLSKYHKIEIPVLQLIKHVLLRLTLASEGGSMSQSVIKNRFVREDPALLPSQWKYEITRSQIRVKHEKSCDWGWLGDDADTVYGWAFRPFVQQLCCCALTSVRFYISTSSCADNKTSKISLIITVRPIQSVFSQSHAFKCKPLEETFVTRASDSYC